MARKLPALNIKIFRMLLLLIKLKNIFLYMYNIYVYTHTYKHIYMHIYKRIMKNFKFL